ncbi:MAG: hypothetical protein MUC88_08045 [Planctomycetes bacterium]|jgi:hypothetical protein|nr:hypothetical protein [Planctomycetota bacterium]
MKQVLIGQRTFSKVICGTNPFYGHSHFSEARNAEYLGRFDDETIARTIRACVRRGVNTVESSANQRILSILATLRQDTSPPLHFVGTTRIDETSDMKSHQRKLAFLIENRADICVVHSQYVDRPGKAGSIEGLEPLIEQIHAAGLLAGISTHRVRTIEWCETQGYEIDTYMFPLNTSGFVYPGYDGSESVRDRVDVVRGVSKPFILIKALGAGRIPPNEGLQFLAEHAKPNDLISLGLASEPEIDESLGLIENLF